MENTFDMVNCGMYQSDVMCAESVMRALVESPKKAVRKLCVGGVQVANSGGIRSDSVILPPELRNIYMKVPDFSCVCSLCHSHEPAVLHDPPLRSVPRPIGEGLSIAFWASQLSETP